MTTFISHGQGTTALKQWAVFLFSIAQQLASPKPHVVIRRWIPEQLK